jgi:hypothetical protein
MPKDRPANVSRLLGEMWVNFMKESRHQSALLTGVLGYMASQETKDAELERGSKSQMYMAVEALRAAEAAIPKEPECSFCGRGKPAVSLVAGPGAFICNECVSLVTHILEHEAHSAGKKIAKSKRSQSRGRRKTSD